MLYEAIRQGCEEYHQRYAGYDRSYNKFFAEKDQAKWDVPETLDEAEITRVISFLKVWNPRRPMDSTALASRLPQVLEDLNELQSYTILDVEFTEKTTELIWRAFNSLTNCGARNHKGSRENESVAASKILHLINPALFVAWDGNIRGKRYWRDWPSELCWYWPKYAYEFLPKVQQRTRMVINELVNDRQLSSDEEAIRFLTDHCKHNNSLAKIIDEYNFVISR